MSKTRRTSIKADQTVQRSALASPLRLEILGLFTNPEPLAIADMARLMGRTPGSLYHHVGLLEAAGLLQRAGTRPKGKRHEALFQATASKIEFESPPGDGDAAAQAVKAMSAALRMTERDLEAALSGARSRPEGPDRNLLAGRVHLRASPRLLARINQHIDAILDLLAAEAAKPPKPTPKDQYLSLTMALLPLKGRGRDDNETGE